MTVVKNDICEFCGEQRKWTASTSFHGFYCLDCLKLERAESMDATRSIYNKRSNEKESGNKAKKV